VRGINAGWWVPATSQSLDGAVTNKPNTNPKTIPKSNTNPIP